jgi:hypothetical protein
MNTLRILVSTIVAAVATTVTAARTPSPLGASR